MKQKQQPIIEGVRLKKFVHGGQVLAHLPDAKTAFVWGGLPDELVNIRVIKRKRSHCEAIVERVMEKSPDRIEALEPNIYLSTSPWQIVSWDAENHAKQEILEETFAHEGVTLAWLPFVAETETQATIEASVKTSLVASPRIDVADRRVENLVGVFGYRNKMEFGFYGDVDGLHLAHYVRGTHGKQITDGSVLAMEPINTAARAICEQLNLLKVWGGDLKTLIVRCSQAGECVAALFVKKKDIDFSNFTLPDSCKGLAIYYSDPKSPASILTKKLVSVGDGEELSDQLNGRKVNYNVLSFFQVNVPVFERALKVIETTTAGLPKIDIYSGVGSIGVAIEGTDTLVESDKSNIAMAKMNTSGMHIKVVHATSETALDYIDGTHAIIVDPPRAGLHAKVVERLLEAEPPVIVYLSCNPSTQVRDVAALQKKYEVTLAQGFNFFPRTPHIESLLVLKRR